MTVSFSIIIGLVVYSKDKFESNAMICSKNHLNRAIVFFIRLSFFFLKTGVTLAFFDSESKKKLSKDLLKTVL